MDDDVAAFDRQLEQYFMEKSITESETLQIFANIWQFFQTLLLLYMQFIEELTWITIPVDKVHLFQRSASILCPNTM